MFSTTPAEWTLWDSASAQAASTASIRQHGSEDIDHLPFAAGLAFQLALHAAQDWRQLPFLEGSTIAKGAGLASQDGDVVQRIMDGLAAPEGCLLTPKPCSLVAKRRSNSLALPSKEC
jgi:hypothetical protein